MKFVLPLAFTLLLAGIAPLSPAEAASARLCAQAVRQVLAPIAPPAPVLGKSELLEFFDRAFLAEANISTSAKQEYHRLFSRLLEKQIARSQQDGLFKHPDRNEVWEKRGLEIPVYADGISKAGKTGDLHSLREGLLQLAEHLKAEGVDLNLMLHTLAPFPSVVDNGFDPINIKTVRREFGGMFAMNKLLALGKQSLKKAKSIQFRFTLDLIANHSSDLSAWYKQAKTGNQEALDLFVVAYNEPKIIRKEIIDGGTWITYELKNSDGTVTRQTNRLIFPDFAHSHWRRQELDDGRTAWFFHYFKPEQPDLNWNNPKVALIYVDFINHWVNRGVDLFRLDAIPFLNKTAEGHPQTLQIVEFLRTYASYIAPHVHFRSEANLEPEQMKDFLGDTVHYRHPETGQTHSTNSRATAGYSFDIKQGFWVSLLGGSKKFFEEALSRISTLSKTTALTNLFASHDELSNEMGSAQMKRIIIEKLLLEKKRGVRFRGESDQTAGGVSGTMSSFVDGDPLRMKLIHAINYALEGTPSTQFQDMFGMKNNLSVMRDAGKDFDSRTIHRLEVPLETLREGGRTPQEKRIFQDWLQVVRARFGSEALMQGTTKIVENNSDNVTTFLRHTEGEKVLVVTNFAEKPVAIEVSNRELGLPGSRTELTDLISRGEVNVSVEGDLVRLTVKPYQALYLSLAARYELVR